MEVLGNIGSPFGIMPSLLNHVNSRECKPHENDPSISVSHSSSYKGGLFFGQSVKAGADPAGSAPTDGENTQPIRIPDGENMQTTRERERA